MAGVFREGHNKRPPRRREPLVIGRPENPWKKRATLAVLLLAVLIAALLMLMMGTEAQAHSRVQPQTKVLDRPIAGIRNNYWYDYRSDIEEAEIELRKDLRRARTAQDEREAWAEYRQELHDARVDYRREMVENGYIARRGRVKVGY